jgi:RimJ/RimL family protein N-acetyltransferase
MAPRRSAPAVPPSVPDGPDLLLRGHREDDLDAIVDQCQDVESQRWTTVPVPYRESDARWFIDHVAEGWRGGVMAAFAIEFQGRFAGTIDLRLHEGEWAEVGFGLAPWARGQHVMRRSLTLALIWAFDELGLTGVCWRAHVGNEASRKVAKACGFRVEGTVRGLCVQSGARVDAWIGTVLRGQI